MRKFLFLFLLFPFLVRAQITVRIQSLPAATPAGSSIFIAGSFNNWNAGDDAYQLQLVAGKYQIILPQLTGQVEYKFTRGTWATVEGNVNGNFIPNRSFNASQTNSIICDIAGWEDQKSNGNPSTALSNVKILSNQFELPQLGRTRRVWVYLPSDYASSQKQYPVLYMHDGQNVFDQLTSFSGEWGVDESLFNREKLGLSTAIVVAIDHGGTKRLDEYSPFVNTQYGGGEGEAYCEFLVQTLKPFIDSAYRTLPDYKHTGIAGSSMGGLISMYAGLKYPMVFGKIGVFSPAFWFSDSLFLWAKKSNINKNSQWYFVSGANESEKMVPDMKRMDSLIISLGLDSLNRKVVVKQDGAHSEWFWKREFPAAFHFLFPTDLSSLEELSESRQIKLFPNPASQWLQIKSPMELDSIFVINSTGNVLMKKENLMKDAKLDISGLAAGNYVLVFYVDAKMLIRKFSVQHN